MSEPIAVPHTEATVASEIIDVKRREPALSSGRPERVDLDRCHDGRRFLLLGFGRLRSAKIGGFPPELHRLQPSGLG